MLATTGAGSIVSPRYVPPQGAGLPPLQPPCHPGAQYMRPRRSRLRAPRAVRPATTLRRRPSGHVVAHPEGIEERRGVAQLRVHLEPVGQLDQGRFAPSGSDERDVRRAARRTSIRPVTLRSGSPATAAGVELPVRKWSPLMRSVVHAGLSVSDTIASRSYFASVSSIAIAHHRPGVLRAPAGTRGRASRPSPAPARRSPGRTTASRRPRGRRRTRSGPPATAPGT